MVVPILVGLGTAILLTGTLRVFFGIGFRLSGLRNIPRSVLLVTIVVYMVLLAVMAMLPIESHAVRQDMPIAASGNGASLRMDVVIPVILGVVAIALLPVLVSYGVARIARRAANAAQQTHAARREA